MLPLLNSCVSKFIPVTNEDNELLVVQGLITDQPEADTIKLSRSLPFGQVSDARPVSGSIVTISDNQGVSVRLMETVAGTYITPAYFHGIAGLWYTLHIYDNKRNYESIPMEMLSVPPIDSLYWEKTVIQPANGFFPGVDGCQIYLNTHDPENKCKFYRWSFTETWVFRLPYPVPNQICWITENSHDINIKNMTSFSEDRIERYPINYITNVTDRLQTKYSIIVNQYAVSEDEYNYWQKIQNVAVQVGSLYDIIPASIPSNIQCIETPSEKVLGYFSVSGKSSKRIFIKDKFSGIIDRYTNAICIKDTIPYVDPSGLGTSVWILDDEPYHIGPYKITTDNQGCADCTLRGSNVKPSFWVDDK